ncbi:hypothetical protein [Actinoplanes sp. NPDC049599]|jgi:hypothetical protein|uniref:hypothetical protein n=1 Tax=Actinoplanes sp. NPDC049599 TaxID=3363903 RepID=UPI0037B02C5D
MDKYSSAIQPAARTRVLKIAQERFASTDEARAALTKAIADISDDQLRFARGFNILVMA